MSHEVNAAPEGAERNSVTQEEREGRGRAFRILLEGVRGWARDIVFSALIAIVIVVFIIQPVKVEGTSMQPKLADQERIFVNKFVYYFSNIQRGDIVVFWYPKDLSKSFIKRVIGLPGEKVEVRSGVAFINDRRLIEPYIVSERLDDSSSFPDVVPVGHYFMLGDHRSSSSDSRNWGFVPHRNIFGKAVFRYWPVSKLGIIN